MKEQKIEFDKSSNGLQTSIDKALAAYKEEKESPRDICRRYSSCRCKN